MDLTGSHSGSREEAIMRWVPLARRIAAGEYRRLGNLTKLLVIDVNDLFQSGVIGLILAVDHFDEGRSAPQTYFTRRIRGAIYDFLRSFPYIQWNGERVERADESELESRPSRCPEFARVEVRTDFERLLQGLTTQQRDVVRGVAQEIPQSSIARHLGLTPGRVSQIKAEALIALRSAAGCSRDTPIVEDGRNAEPDTDPTGGLPTAEIWWGPIEPDVTYEMSVR